MHVDALRRAYDELLTTAAGVANNLALSPEACAEMDWRLCHLALSDEILLSAAHATLRGTAAVVDNARAMDSSAIAAMIAQTSLQQRIEAVASNGTAFLQCLAKFSESQSAASIHLIIHDRSGALVSNTSTTWNELIQLRTTRHLPAHTATLAAITTGGR